MQEGNRQLQEENLVATQFPALATRGSGRDKDERTLGREGGALGDPQAF